MRDIEEAIGYARTVHDAPSHVLTSYEDINFVLRSQDFAPLAAEAGHGAQWHTLVIRGVAADLHGQEHFERRRILTALLKRTAVLKGYEQEYLIPEIDRLLRAAPAVSGDPDNVRVDLVTELRRSLIRLIARLVGVDRVVEGTKVDEEFESLVAAVERGVRSKFVENQEQVTREALNAQHRMVEEYFNPARKSREEIYARIRAGELDDDAMPNDLLSLIVRHQDYYDGFGPDAANREASLLMVAAVGSTVNALCFAVADLDRWLRRHPEDEDRRLEPAFLQRCFAESMRLGQTNNLYRTATTTTTLPSGTLVKDGEVVIVNRPAGNAELESGGTSAIAEHGFDPDRVLQGKVAQYGLGFGGGAHMCIGKDLAVAGFPRLASVEADQLGLAVRMFRMLQERGARVDLDATELVEDMTGRPTWKTLVVECRRTVEAKGGAPK